VRGARIRPWRATEAEIDSPGKERFERTELLGDDERRVIRQHDAARADAYGGRAGGDMRDDDRRRCAGDSGHVVMLGDPETPVAETLRLAREIERTPQRVAGVAAFENRRQIQDRHVHAL